MGFLKVRSKIEILLTLETIWAAFSYKIKLLKALFASLDCVDRRY